MRNLLIADEQSNGIPAVVKEGDEGRRHDDRLLELLVIIPAIRASTLE
jgi:hypothetical protein